MRYAMNVDASRHNLASAWEQIISGHLLPDIPKDICTQQAVCILIKPFFGGGGELKKSSNDKVVSL